jgi:hypothetical protein
MYLILYTLTTMSHSFYLIERQFNLALQKRGYIYMFNATFSNILVISLMSVLMVEETEENHRPVASH